VKLLSIKAINKQMADEEVRSQAKVYSYCDAFLCGVVSKVPLSILLPVLFVAFGVSRVDVVT
jgi:hypothetical protein